MIDPLESNQVTPNECWTMGYASGRSGKPADECPYYYDDMRACWIDGWRIGRHESR